MRQCGGRDSTRNFDRSRWSRKHVPLVMMGPCPIIYRCPLSSKSITQRHTQVDPPHRPVYDSPLQIWCYWEACVCATAFICRNKYKWTQQLVFTTRMSLNAKVLSLMYTSKLRNETTHIAADHNVYSVLSVISCWYRIGWSNSSSDTVVILQVTCNTNIVNQPISSISSLIVPCNEFVCVNWLVAWKQCPLTIQENAILPNSISKSSLVSSYIAFFLQARRNSGL